jgi:hypothetical protein
MLPGRRGVLTAIFGASCADGLGTADAGRLDVTAQDHTEGMDVSSPRDVPTDADTGTDVPTDAGARADLPMDVPTDVPPAPLRETVVPSAAEWRYRDDGREPAAAWRDTDFDDGSWRAGPAQLGFGDGDEATRISDGASPTGRHIAHYFRHVFAVRDAARVQALTLRLLRDDGAVVYLNGREVHRANMPEGTVAADTLAPTTTGFDDEDTFFTASLDPTALREGRNVLAVEVHQSAPDSSDLSFDLRLDVSRDPGDAAGTDPVAIAVGDAASCDWTGDEDTANLLDGLPGTIFALGDLAYLAGTETEFRNCFHPTWGRHRARMRPAPGNHDYGTENGAAYHRYFGDRAGAYGAGYYSYELGAWHVVVLNSNCDAIGGCGDGSAQHRWLVADLQRSRARCTAAYWHHPRFTSAPRGPNAFMSPLWQALYDGGADVVFQGHEHHYERLAPMRADGTRDAARGMRSFVVGTGSAPFYGFPMVHPNSEVRRAEVFGALRLVLRPTGYDWRFVPIARQRFEDTGSAECH